MTDIVLSTLNARYAHSAFGLRYLLANLGTLQNRARILEFDIKHRAVDVAERILSVQPKILGLGVYIWNAQLSTEVVEVLKAVRPDLVIVLGGPEVSYETDQQEVVRRADYVITGEGDEEFRRLCEDLLAGRPRPNRVVAAPFPEVATLVAPYALYTDEDIAHRTLYVEASRGCPFSCEFCLSSLDIPVRAFPLDQFLTELGTLLDRGATQFKFVDRTFNLVESAGLKILAFLLERYRPGCFFHFEMVPDRLPHSLKDIIRQFPPGALQFEVGVQTFNEEVATLISRRQNYSRLEENLRFLRGETGVHIHADLIAGLPGESLESFGAGFDRLIALAPHEIQVGILKRLRGTPIARHTSEWRMEYNAQAPYEILSNRLISFASMQRLRRFARFWDLVGNSGNFRESVLMLWSTSLQSPFIEFGRFSEWVYDRLGRTDSIALGALAQALFTYLVEVKSLPADAVATTLWRDYQRAGRSDRPPFLAPYVPHSNQTGAHRSIAGLPKRQARHCA